MNYFLHLVPTTAVSHVPLLPAEDSLHDDGRAGNGHYFLQHSLRGDIPIHHLLSLDHLPHHNAHSPPKPSGELTFGQPLSTNHSALSHSIPLLLLTHKYIPQEINPTCSIKLLHFTLKVGLAVDDIKSVQEKAALKKEALQVYILVMVCLTASKYYTLLAQP